MLLDKEGALIDSRSTRVPAFGAAFGFQPTEVAVVGDTSADLVMARDAGCAMALAVATGAIPLSQLAGRASHALPWMHEIETLL
jgi:phosphoglycolate phosphatase-like HAD superfamily hydrolase